MDSLILYDVDDQVGIITLNRPDKLNAISHELYHALTDAFVCVLKPAPRRVLCCCTLSAAVSASLPH